MFTILNYIRSDCTIVYPHFTYITIIHNFCYFYSWIIKNFSRIIIINIFFWNIISNCCVLRNRSFTNDNIFIRSITCTFNFRKFCYRIIIILLNFYFKNTRNRNTICNLNFSNMIIYFNMCKTFKKCSSLCI